MTCFQLDAETPGVDVVMLATDMGMLAAAMDAETPVVGEVTWLCPRRTLEVGRQRPTFR